MDMSDKERGEFDGFYRGRDHALQGIPRVDISKLGLSLVSPEYDQGYREGYDHGYDVGTNDISLILHSSNKRNEPNRSITRNDGFQFDEHEFQDELEFDR